MRNKRPENFPSCFVVLTTISHLKNLQHPEGSALQILRRGETLSSRGGTAYQGSYFWLHEVPVGAVLLAGIVTEMTPSHDCILY